MGLLDLILGKQNPFSQYVDSNANAVHGAFAGLGRGTNFGDGLGYAAQGAAAGAPADRVYQKDAQEKADREAKIKQSSADLAKWPDLVKYVADTGDTAGAFGEAFKRSSPGYGDPNYGKPAADPTDSYAGRLQAGREQGLTGTDLGNYALTGKLPETPKQQIPVGYQPASDGNGLTFTPGGPADPATAGKTTEATRRNQQLAKVIEPEVKSLLGPNGDGKGGTFDALTNGWSQGLDAMGPLGLVVGGGPTGEYQQAKNSLKTIIASYLYSVSGATANPGEVETQASVLTPKPGEPESSVNDKKRRIAVMVQAVKEAAKGTPIAVDDNGAPASGSGDQELQNALNQYGN